MRQENNIAKVINFQTLHKLRAKYIPLLRNPITTNTFALIFPNLYKHKETVNITREYQNIYREIFRTT
jgi:hypothetical protein